MIYCHIVSWKICCRLFSLTYGYLILLSWCNQQCQCIILPTLSLGISLNSEPCFRKTSPAVWAGLIPTPSSVMIALVSGVDLNCSAANLTTAVKGVESGTLKILYGNFGSEVRVILKVTFVVEGADDGFSWVDISDTATVILRTLV